MPTADIKIDNESTLRAQIENHRLEWVGSLGDWPDRHDERFRRFNADPSLRPPGPWPDAPNFFIPRTRDVLEKLLSEIWTALFSQDENIKLVPFGEDDVEGAQLASRFEQWALRTTPDLQWWNETAKDIIFDGLLDSAAVAKVTAWSPPWETPKGFFDKIARIDPLDLNTFIVPPDATGLQYPEARYVGQVFFLTRDDLLRMKKQGYVVPDVDSVSYSDQMPTERERSEIEREGITLQPFKRNTVRFIEMYERFTVDSTDKFEEDIIVSYFPDAQTTGEKTRTSAISRVRRLSTINDGKIGVFPRSDRPRRPFFELSFWKMPRQWRGMNVPDRIDSMQDLINKLHEQMVNHGDVSMLPYIFADIFTTGDLPDLRQVRPGSTIPVESTSGIQFAPTRSMNRHYAEQISLANANIERGESVTDATLGRQGQGNTPRTATASLAFLSQSQKAFGILARQGAIKFVRMLRFHFQLWQSIIPNSFIAPLTPASEVKSVKHRDILLRLFDGELEGKFIGRETTKRELSGVYNVQLTIRPDAAIDRQVNLAMAQIVIPAIPGYILGQREMIRRVYESHELKGFEQVWPEHIARTDTAIHIITKRIQLFELQQQLEAVSQQQEQATDQQAQQDGQQRQVAERRTALAPTPGENGTETPVARRILDALQTAGDSEDQQ